MEQRDTISSPNLAALEDQARGVAAHPAFGRALAAFCKGLIDFHTGRRVANLGMGDTLGWALATLIGYLDHSSPEGAGSAQLVELCTAGGLAGPKAVRGAIRVLAHCGLVAEEARANDRRAKRLRCTERLFELQREYVAARLIALEVVQPLPRPAREWARDDGVVMAFLGGNVEAFARCQFRLYDGFPEVRQFMDRASGYLILLEILRSGRDGASLSSMAASFHVSRTHVRKLLAAASEQGRLRLEARSGRVSLDPAFLERLRDWIALEFVWMWRLVRPDRCDERRIWRRRGPSYRGAYQSSKAPARRNSSISGVSLRPRL